MFLETAEAIRALQSLATDYKFVITLLAALGLAYRAFDWIKQIRTKDLIEIHSGIKDLKVELKSGMDNLSNKLDTQTTSVVGELKELRSDFRAFYIPPAPILMPARAKAPKRPVRRAAKKSLQSK